jgi:hypothetical protein
MVSGEVAVVDCVAAARVSVFRRVVAGVQVVDYVVFARVGVARAAAARVVAARVAAARVAAARVATRSGAIIAAMSFGRRS